MTVTPTTARPRTTIARTLVLASMLAVGLTACSGSDDTESGSGDADEPSGEDAPKGVIDKLIEDAYAGWDTETSTRKQMQVEEQMAACMGDLGFEYTPVDYSTNPAASLGTVDDEIPWDTLEFAEQWGYGIATGPGMDAMEDAEEQGWVDPNTALVEAMSATEQQAYYEALYGRLATEDLASGTDVEAEISWEEMGCSGKAQHEVFGDAFSAQDPYADLMDEMQRVEESIATDDRVVATVAAWASCMAGAGHADVSEIGDGEELINAKVEPVLAADEAWEAVEVKLADIAEEEIDLAVDDYTCRDESGYTDAYNEVDLELQQEFYDANKAELEEMVAYQKELIS